MILCIRRTGVLLALSAVFALAGCDAFTSTDTRVARASRALDDGNLAAAQADARAAVEKDPGHVEGWLLMARLSLKYGDGEGALRDLQRAADAGASPAQMLSLRGKALLAAGRFEEVLQLPADTAEQQVAHAAALAALDRREEAAQRVAAVLAGEPNHVQARLLNARLLAADRRTGEARTIVEQVLAGSPDNAEASLLRARLALGDADNTAALAALEKAAAGAARQLTVPEHAGLLTALVETSLTAGDTEKASTALGQLRQLAPKSALVDFYSARISLAQGDVTAAVATLQRTLAKEPTLAQARLLLGAALIQQGANEQARSHLDNLIAEQPGNLAARRLMAQLMASQGDTRGAERVLAQLPEGVQTDATTQWMRSSLLAESGQHSEALAALELAARTEPANIRLQMDLVRAYLSVGRQDLAKSTLQAIPEQKDGWAGKQLHVLKRVIGDSPERQVESLVALARENPDDAELRTVIGQLLSNAGARVAAAAEFRAALEKKPSLSEARLGLAAVLTAQGNLEDAAQQLRGIITTDPANERAYLGLAMLANRKGSGSEARRWLEQAIGAVPSAGTARLALAELSYRENQAAAADALLEQAITVAPDKPAALMRAAEVQLRAAQPQRAAATLERAFAQRPGGQLAVRLFAARQAAKLAEPEQVLHDWLKRHPDDATVRSALAEHLLNKGDHPAAIAEYETLTQRSPAAAHLNNLAWLYQSTGDARAEATAKRAHDAAPDNPQVADTYGWILLEKGRVGEALPLLTKAAQALPGDAEVQEHLNTARARAEKPKP
jgi:putative PEP-CTERM system TPR-repeat lipoprotein